MPEMNKVFSLKITPEQFLDACSPLELKEVEMLILSNRYQCMRNVHDAPILNSRVGKSNGKGVEL